MRKHGDDCVFEAWVHGPVNVTLYNKLKEYSWVTIEIIDPDETLEELSGKFDEDKVNILKQVWEFYGHYTANDLEYFVHQEKPWLEQRGGLEFFENCTNPISVQTMKEYYGAISGKE